MSLIFQPPPQPAYQEHTAPPNPAAYYGFHAPPPQQPYLQSLPAYQSEAPPQPPVVIHQVYRRLNMGLHPS